MSKENLRMGKYNLTIQNTEKALSIFSRKNGEIYFCINEGNKEKKYILNYKSAKIIGEKLVELSKTAEILEKSHLAKNSNNHFPEINEDAIEELLNSIYQN
jgi:hypothetical protein